MNLHIHLKKEIEPPSRAILRSNNLQFHYMTAQSDGKKSMGRAFCDSEFLPQFLLAAKSAGYQPPELINLHFVAEKSSFPVNSAQCIGAAMARLPANSWAEMSDYLRLKFDIKVNSSLPSNESFDAQLKSLDHHAGILGVSRFATASQISARTIELNEQIESDKRLSAEAKESKRRECSEASVWLLANAGKSFPAMDMLNSMTGLHNVKKEVYRLMCLFQAQMMRKSAGMTTNKPSMHLVFTGNPGTGKTTVARLIGQIYRSLGLLDSGHVIESDRSSLVAEYLGQTSTKTKSIVHLASGGVLFIDEAYSLAGKGDDSYGEEAVNTLLKEMEDRRDSFAVIIAGYTKEMGRFINSNPGLKSRFSRVINFDDYSSQELTDIFLGIAKSEGMVVAAGVAEKVELITSQMVTAKEEGFGNARAIRTLYESTIESQAVRIIEQGALDIDVITAADIAG